MAARIDRRALLRALYRYNAGRDPERVRIKFETMRASAFALARGEPQLFYKQIAMPAALFRAPHVWLCGDLHLENFGAFLGGNGLAYFDLNDFDHATRAVCSWDLIRFLSSLDLACDEVNVPMRHRDDLFEVFIDGYARSLANGKALWYERRVARGPIRRLLKRAAAKGRRDLLRTRTQRDASGQRRLLLDGDRALPLLPGQRQRTHELFRLAKGSSPELARYVLRDAARRIAGLASLGLERYVLLLAPSGRRVGEILLDIKAAQRTAVPHSNSDGPWTTPAERVVSVQRIVQTVAPADLAAINLSGSSFMVRELQPREARIRIKELAAHAKQAGTRSSLAVFTEDLGALTAWAHLRGSGRWGAAPAEVLIAFARRKGWQRPAIRAARDAADRIRDLHRELARV